VRDHATCRGHLAKRPNHPVTLFCWQRVQLTFRVMMQPQFVGRHGFVTSTCTVSRASMSR